MDSNNHLKPAVLWNNLVYFVKELWHFSPKTVGCILLTPVLNVAYATLQAFLPKEIVRMTQDSVTPQHLIIVILLLTGFIELYPMISNPCQHHINNWGLRFRHYLEQKALFRYCQTDYANTEDPKIRELFQRSAELFQNWDKDARTLMWSLGDFFFYLLGIISYAAVIMTLHPIIIVVLVLNTIILNYVIKYTTKWVLKNQDNWIKLDVQSSYILRTGQSLSCAKDIRLYGIYNWMIQTYKKLMDKRMYWSKRMRYVYFLYDCMPNTLLSFLRNSLAYVILIVLVLKGSIRADEFVLYFAMISNLSNWLNDIVRSYQKIRDCAIYLTDYQQLLAYPDQFDYKNGKGLPP